MNHVEKYYWIINHTGIGVADMQASIELTPHMVYPETDRIEEDTSLNTKFEWWVEFCKLDEIQDDFPTHYWELDCGGDTAEAAIDKLYELVLERYGEYDKN